MIGSTNATIIIGGGGGGSKAIIRTAEMPDVTITLSQNGTGIESKTTPATTGGIVDFEVDTIGTYTLTASGNDITTWAHNVDVTELNTIVECKAGTLANYTYAQWHTALQGGYFSIMFNLKDSFTYSQSGNILHNHKFFVEKITQVGGKEIVDFRMANKYSGGNYNINPYIAWVTSSSATSWTSNYRSYGGYKYSAMRQRMMEMGEDVYSQATGILPDDYSGSLTTGIKFSDLKYSDTGLTCPIYSYSSSADTLTLLNAPLTAAPSDTAIMLIKGYFKSVGQIDETTFNAGVYYTATTVSSATIYTKATTYTSGTTYYGLYEKLQEDGIFAGALKTSNFASYLAKFSDSASAGGKQTSMVSSFSDYADIPAVEEITGVNRTTTLMSGVSGTSIYAYNLAGEGTKKPSYDFSVQAIGSEYWTRSASSNYSYSFCYINNIGYINYHFVYDTYGVRLGFRLQ